jgi:hypothetical protein
MLYLPLGGRQTMPKNRSAAKKTLWRCYLVEGRQSQRNDLLQKRLSGDAILAFSGRQTIPKKWSPAKRLSGDAILAFSGRQTITKKWSPAKRLSGDAILAFSGRQTIPMKWSPEKRLSRDANVYLPLVEGRQWQEADLLRTRKSGDAILAFSGRQTIPTKWSPAKKTVL